MTARKPRIGLLSSIGSTLDAFFIELINVWSVAGADVYPAAGSEMKGTRTDVIEGLTQRPGLGSLRALHSLRDWIRQRDLDVIITSTATASTLVRLSSLEIPVIYFCHGLHWPQKANLSGRVWKAVEATLAKRTKAAIVLNSEDNVWMDAHVGQERVLRLPYGVGVPIEVFERTLLPSTANTPLRLAWIGDFTARKRPGLALEVASQLKASGLDFMLTMAGNGPLHAGTRANIESRGLSDVVALPGRVAASGLLASSHALLHTASWEGLARVLLESAAIGRNAYGFDVKGVRDAPAIAVVKDANTSLLAGLIVNDWVADSKLQALPPLADLDVEKQAQMILAFVAEQMRWGYGAR